MLPTIDTKNPLHIVALCFGIVLFCARFRRYLKVRAFKRAHKCQPVVRAPQPERILGLATYQKLRRIRREHILLQEISRRALETGRTNTVVVLGQENISTCDPENIKTILATKFLDYGIGPRIYVMGRLLGKGIFTLDDVPWQHSRALIRPGFTRNQVADLGSLETHVQALISCLPTFDGMTVDLQPLFFNLTIDSTTDFLLGQSVCCQGSAPGSAARQFSNAFDYAEGVLDRRSELGYFAWLLRDRKFDEACDIVHHFTNRYIREALKGNTKPGRYNLLAELARAFRDPVQIRDELLNVLLAARDTTASLLSSVFYLLARNPGAWEMLSKEVGELGGRVPDYKILKEMRYLKSVLNETLRLFPPVPISARFARTDTVLPHGGGQDGMSPIYVAKGTRVVYSVWAMHRLPEIWGSDGELFRPERWLDKNDENALLRPGWGYLVSLPGALLVFDPDPYHFTETKPFSGGPRLCLGQQNALVEASYIIVRLLQVFDRIESRDTLPWQENLAVTLSSLHGTKVALWRRMQ